MIEFWNTQMGRKFIEGTMPEIGRQLKRLADIMEKDLKHRQKFSIAQKDSGLVKVIENFNEFKRRREMSNSGEFSLDDIHNWALWCLGENESILDSIDTDSATYAAGVLAVCDKVVGADSVVTHQLYAQMNKDKKKTTEDHWYHDDEDEEEEEEEDDGE